jgi:transposase
LQVPRAAPGRFEELMMEVVVARAAALDIGKRSVVACVRVPGGGRRRQEVCTFGTFLDELSRLREWLVAEQVTQVAMEATGSYWKPIWYVLEDLDDVELLLVNARHVKQVPGRKTDVKDAVWLCELLEVGLLRSSLVPAPTIRQLRDLTRYRKRLVQDRTRETQRVEKTLEDAVIKLGAVASSTMTKSGRAMIEALIAGERDPDVLAQLAKGRMRTKMPELVRALDGRFETHHAHMLRLHLDHIDHLDTAIGTIDERIEELMGPFAEVRARLQTIPGVGQKVADVLIAETGADMSRFPDAAHLASWAGVCPGNNESAGKRFSGRTRKANDWLQSMLVDVAWAAARTKDTYLAAQFWRLAGRIGKKKAAMAVAHSILVIAYHLMADPEAVYEDLGPDWFARRNNPDVRRQRLVKQLADLGYDVELTPKAA